MITERISKDEVGLLLAQVWAMRGTCARRQVGCVLVDADGYPIGSGYNGPAAGQPHCIDKHCPGAGAPPGTSLDLCEALHAEWNALMRCSDIRRVHACYVTSSPCVTCTKLLLNTGCRRVVFLDRYVQDGSGLWLRAGREWTQHQAKVTTMDLRCMVGTGEKI